ncbi:MAG: dihydrolipoyllysine-residue acetyltransferase [Burkholderiaceae bacterium]|jgi:pyruvate dehydrogenase E2 component (dihydrolipoamide acetyltransferase)|nr:dihydrolipoyllysine-residue acetyltransferase [Burkholderiaceae bacterium]
MSGTIEVRVPDIGDFEEVEVIEVMVSSGDEVQAEQSLVTVESDKASMEIPSSASGRVVELRVKVGDKVSEGSVLLVLEEGAGGSAGSKEAPAPAPAPKAAKEEPARAPAPSPAPDPDAPGPAEDPDDSPPAPGNVERSHPVPVEMRDGISVLKPHASPSVRHFARELGVDLARVTGTGPKQRITRDDVLAFVKSVVAKPASAPAEGAGLGLIPWPKVDFARFGPIERKPLARVRKLSAANLHRNWVMIPHVTNHDDADVTELEAFRLQLNDEAAKDKSGVKITMLAFLIKACVATLRRFPEFNCSLEGEELVLKQYYHIGFAADTPNGLVVPVIRDADKKGLIELASETATLAAKAREGKLSPKDMQGGTFSISSLGGIGGTYFTPIINAPEVAILGVSRAARRPIWDGDKFVPRLVVPLSLSYDHRVIDGAAAARFNAYLAQLLADFRRSML